MRGTALSSLLTQLKAEIGYSLDASATGKDAALIQLLANKQNWLASEYDFPFLQDSWDLVCAPNSRYLAIPTTDRFGSTVNIDFERPLLVEVRWGNYWNELDYGIGAEQYNALDSEAGQTSDPIQRFQFWDNPVGTQQVEVWPMPSTSQTIRFTGQRALRALASLTDKADLDDLLLVLYVAVDVVPAEEKQLKLGAAQERLRRLLGSYSQKTQSVVFGKRKMDRAERKLVPTIAVAGSGGSGQQIYSGQGEP